MNIFTSREQQTSFQTFQFKCAHTYEISRITGIFASLLSHSRRLLYAIRRLCTNVTFHLPFHIQIHCEKETQEKAKYLAATVMRRELIDVYLMKLSRNAHGIRFTWQILSHFAISSCRKMQLNVFAFKTFYQSNVISFSIRLKPFEYFHAINMNSLTNHRVFSAFFVNVAMNLSK